MREYLDQLRKHGLLTQIQDTLSTDFEIPSVLYSKQDRPLLFENVEGHSLRLAGNLYGTKELLSFGLGVKKEALTGTIQGASEHPSESIGSVTGFKRSDWDYNGDADLSKLPVLKHFEREAGRYLTAGVVAAKFPGSDAVNLSVHRMLVLDKDKVVARIVPRHLSQIKGEASGERVRVSIIIGPPPPVFTASSLQTKFGVSEYSIANKLANSSLKLTSSELSNIPVPVDCEVLLEGWLDTREAAPEGPFVDLTGTYDDVRDQPIVKLDRMHFRKDSVYQAIVASSSEHALFMGLPQELKIYDVLSRSVPKIRGVNLTPASNGYFHCVVSVGKSNDGDGKTAILNCLAASHPIKLVIAVDDDVDPFDLAAVEWALATRFQAQSGLVVINGARGSSLDPSSGKLGVTSKMGLDATLPVKADREKFSRAEMSVSERARLTISSISSSKSQASAS
ncbi:MAG TPA: UbiD family decarboxylase [Nitrososphaerales archaeon]|nr:UbiD family decarboxylase [Nitrososphaerales archaeon]